jgi:hypothetical protein
MNRKHRDKCNIPDRDFDGQPIGTGQLVRVYLPLVLAQGDLRNQTAMMAPWDDLKRETHPIDRGQRNPNDQTIQTALYRGEVLVWFQPEISTRYAQVIRHYKYHLASGQEYVPPAQFAPYEVEERLMPHQGTDVRLPPQRSKGALVPVYVTLQESSQSGVDLVPGFPDTKKRQLIPHCAIDALVYSNDIAFRQQTPADIKAVTP